MKTIHQNHEIIARISSHAAAGTLPHALLLTGSTPQAQADVAHRVAAALLCTDDYQRGLFESEAGHPDLQVLVPEGALQLIKIESIRALTEFACQTPQQGHCRVIMIEHADRLNVAAANALLKMLEEPVGRVYWILTSAQISRVLMTVRSRCVIWSLIREDVPKNVQYFLTEMESLINMPAFADALKPLAKGSFDPLKISQTFVNTLDPHEFEMWLDVLTFWALEGLKTTQDPTIDRPVHAWLSLPVYPKYMPKQWSEGLKYLLVIRERLRKPVAQNAGIRSDTLMIGLWKIFRGSSSG